MDLIESYQGRLSPQSYMAFLDHILNLYEQQGRLDQIATLDRALDKINDQLIKIFDQLDNRTRSKILYSHSFFRRRPPPKLLNQLAQWINQDYESGKLMAPKWSVRSLQAICTLRIWDSLPYQKLLAMI